MAAQRATGRNREGSRCIVVYGETVCCDSNARRPIQQTGGLTPCLHPADGRHLHAKACANASGRYPGLQGADQLPALRLPKPAARLPVQTT